MKLRPSLAALVVLVLLPCALARPQTPFSGITEPGVPFPLPQEVGANLRRSFLGSSNSLTISWDGRLVMYQDRMQTTRPSGTWDYGYVFATFNKELVKDDGTGRPSFEDCFGTPFMRFAAVKATTETDVDQNEYPTADNYSGGPYPFITGPSNNDTETGTMGELGLLESESLSNNLYPVPVEELPPEADYHNPFRSDDLGDYDPDGAYETYYAYVTLQDRVKFWIPHSGGANKWVGWLDNAETVYEAGTYPNGVDAPAGLVQKRNGIAKLAITVERELGLDEDRAVTRVKVLDPWEPFQVEYGGTASGLTTGVSVPSSNTMYADNFEPSLTNDGHLMVGKGNPLLATGGGNVHSRVLFYVNQTAFSATEWEGPWELHELHGMKDFELDGVSIGDRYPLARHPIKDYDGSVFDEDAFPGGYTWISPDGRYLLFSIFSGGVGKGHPDAPLLNAVDGDGGGNSNRAQASIVGSVTGWQIWRIDHAAANPSRHLFTGWDQESRTTHVRWASFGFGPGFWEMLRGAPLLPLRDDGRMKLQLINSNRLLYYELDLSAYQERDYGFYLPMTEMITTIGEDHEVDITRTPDLSGNGHVGIVDSVTGGELPCEYFELPTLINNGKNVPGLYSSVTTPELIHLNWTIDDVTPVTSPHWAKLADWEDGVPGQTGGPYEGRGNLHDMDSDTCWGVVGQAMFFRQGRDVVVDNAGTPPELNPGTIVAGASDGMTVSLWVHPLQARTVTTRLFQHHSVIRLTTDGAIEAAVSPVGGPVDWISAPAGSAPDEAWTHVALTWRDLMGDDTSELRLYVNGAEVPSSPLALDYDVLMASWADIRLGCLDACATVPADAVLLLDEVALKNSALPPEDVVHVALAPLPPTPDWTANSSNLPDAPLPFDNEEDSRVPSDNLYDPIAALIGADLFRDVQLSASKAISCMSCHDPAAAFTDPQHQAVSTIGGEPGRNALTVFNQRFQTRQFWDARAENLEDQALDPVFDPHEMGLTWGELEPYLQFDPSYGPRFATLGITDIEENDVRRVLATYMRAPTAGDSLADRFEAGLVSLSAPQMRGRGLFFGKARCVGCHNGPNFTDGRLWTTGTFVPGGDEGASNADAGPRTAGRARFRGAFKTPSLRELGRTKPYFHDGHVDGQNVDDALRDVVEFYNAGGVRTDGNGSPLQSADHDFVAEEINRPLGLTSGEVDDLVAYLALLDGLTVDDGPTGLNGAPTVTILMPPTGPTMFTVVRIKVQDFTDGREDIEPYDANMHWTLEVTIDGQDYDWSDGTVVQIPSGYRLDIPVQAPSSVQARAADHHGRWSALVTN